MYFFIKILWWILCKW